MTNSFSNQVKNFADKTKDKLDKANRELALTLYTQIILASPVDTGRFRANWQTSLGSSADGVLESEDKTGQSTVAKTEQGLVSFVPGQVAYMVNNLPYAGVLENGSSAQAPSGMVKLALQRVPEIVAILSAKYGAM